MVQKCGEGVPAVAGLPDYNPPGALFQRGFDSRPCDGAVINYKDAKHAPLLVNHEQTPGCCLYYDASGDGTLIPWTPEKW